MGETQLWDIFRSLLGFAGVIFVGLGAWWCKSMASDIKDLQEKEHTTQLAIVQLQATGAGRDGVQDERWKNLDEDMKTLKGHVETILRKGYNPYNSKSTPA